MSKTYAPVCEGEELHEERIARSVKAMPDIMSLYDLSDFFKILGDSTRMGILFVLDEGQLCVCDIAYRRKPAGQSEPPFFCQEGHRCCVR